MKKNVPWQNRTATQAIFYWAQECPNAVAIDDGEQQGSYFELASVVANIVHRVRELGVSKGCIVGIRCDDRYLSLVLLLAMDALRATPAYLSTADVMDQAWLDRCNVVLSKAPLALGLSARCFVVMTQDWLISARPYNSPHADLSVLDHPCDDTDIIFLGSTSSTTGEKKYFQDSRFAMQHQLGLLSDLYFPTETVNFICIYSVWLGAAYAACFICLNKGATVIFSPNLLRDMTRYPGSHSVLVLRDAVRLTANLREDVALSKLSSLRVLGAHLPNIVRNLLETHLADQVMNSYSSNESGQVGEVLRDGTAKIYSGVEVKIVDDERLPLATGQIGYIAIKSPGMVQGYLWNEALTQKHFSNGWFYSSDLGYKTEIGHLVIEGRNDEMLNLGGVKISPTPYEQSIKAQLGISECVLLCDDNLFGARHLIVFIEKSGECDMEIKKLYDQLQYLPAGEFDNVTTLFLSTFPRTDTGKVKRQELKVIAKEMITCNPIS